MKSARLDTKFSAADTNGSRKFCVYEYRSPIGNLVLCSDGNGLSQLWFAGRNPQYDRFLFTWQQRCDEHITAASLWLDEYFAGRVPDFLPHLSLHSTDFRSNIWKMLLQIPYGEVVTYGDLAKRYAASHGISRMAAQAVGQAVGANPVCIIIPCHRVIGAGNKLTGYAGGLDKKIALLRHERFSF